MIQGDVAWTPPPDARERTELGRYLEWLERERGLDLADYDALWRWSVTDLEGFWSSLWDFFEVRAHTPYERVLGSREMPGAEWFPGARLNFAEHMVGRDDDLDAVAVVAHSQTRESFELTFGELREQVARARAGLQRLGVGEGDRVVAYLPNIPETLVAFLACASLGAIWATCPPEFGVRSVLHRLGQLEPKLLLAVAGYRWGERLVDRRQEVMEVRSGLPSLGAVVDVPYPEPGLADAVSWGELLADEGPLEFEPLPFTHPLYVLFSSGTTGLPKAIVHGHGGILLEHQKNHSLSWDLKPGDRLQWFTTTAWMMWNALVSTLLLRASVVMIDGNPAHPDLSYQWALAEETRPTMLGVSPAFVMACRKEGLEPGRRFDLSSIRSIGAAGSPLPVEGFEWLYDQLGHEVFINLGSGGTDICTGIVQGYPLLPVYAGEISGRCLGVDVQAFSSEGQAGRRRARRARDHAADALDAGRPLERPRRLAHARRVLRPLPGRLAPRRLDPVHRAMAARSSPAAPTRRSTAAAFGSGRASSTSSSRRSTRCSTAWSSTWTRTTSCSCSCAPRRRRARRRAARRIATVLRTALSPVTRPTRSSRCPRSRATLTGKKLELPVKNILIGAQAEDVASKDALVDPSSLDAFVDYARVRA